MFKCGRMQILISVYDRKRYAKSFCVGGVGTIVSSTIIREFLGCLSANTRTSCRWQSLNSSSRNSSPNTKRISTRMNTIAFLMSTDLWQSADRNKAGRDGTIFLRESMGIRSTRTIIVLKVESNAEGLLPLSFKSISTRVNGSKCLRQVSGSALVTRLTSARSAVWTISNVASFVHYNYEVNWSITIQVQRSPNTIQISKQMLAQVSTQCDTKLTYLEKAGNNPLHLMAQIRQKQLAKSRQAASQPASQC